MSTNDSYDENNKYPRNSCKCHPVSGLYELTILFRPPRLPWPLPSPVPIPVPVPLPRPIPLPGPLPNPFPDPIPLPGPRPGPGPDPVPMQLSQKPLIFPLFLKEQLRLDVDNQYPLMVASGILFNFPYTVHWIANLREYGGGWTGKIWYTDGDTRYFPYTMVTIFVRQNKNSYPSGATTIFSDGIETITKTFNYKSPYFHEVNFEFDFETAENVTSSFNTCGHPNRPAYLDCEILSIEETFRRTGFDVTTNPGGVVPSADAGANLQWSNAEMHDAMQTYWSRFADKPQWAMWVFFASQHEYGYGLGGIMFDSIGPNHRQGTAVFNDSFVSDAPADESNQDEWVQRNVFWTACHEMGHGFNLAHSWQKSWGTPWIPQINDFEARSFMNYPNNVSGGQNAFYANFEYRFTDEELLFMRHAPSRFVEMGNEDWFSNHGFWSDVESANTLKMEVRVNREDPIFEYMEPVMVEFKLTNQTDKPLLVDANILRSMDSMSLLIKKGENPIREFRPYAKYCYDYSPQLLDAEQSIYESHFISVGKDGWYISEAGKYQIQAILHENNNTIVSHPITINVLPGTSRNEALLGIKYFTDEVGRILTFEGSRVLEKGINVLKNVANEMQGTQVAKHASLVLGNSLISPYRKLVESNETGMYQVSTIPADLTAAKQYIQNALLTDAEKSIETFGHIRYKRLMKKYSKKLAEHNEKEAAKEVLQKLHTILSDRTVHTKKILQSIIDKIKDELDKL